MIEHGADDMSVAECAQGGCDILRRAVALVDDEQHAIDMRQEHERVILR